MSELKPCPLCGSTDVGVAPFAVGCFSCDLLIARIHTDDAVTIWNNRPAEKKVKADGVREAIDEALAQLGWKDSTHYLVVKFIRKMQDNANKLEKGNETSHKDD